ncbi:hypothetical protein E2P81_ATG03635 [Venturia nashicola]|nr:hypothetical protein E2P81_ATG03635 [Venturia nashicola]
MLFMRVSLCLDSYRVLASLVDATWPGFTVVDFIAALGRELACEAAGAELPLCSYGPGISCSLVSKAAQTTPLIQVV